jgi:hypothetical protein
LAVQIAKLWAKGEWKNAMQAKNNAVQMKKYQRFNFG